jgi:hypothetical protein
MGAWAIIEAIRWPAGFASGWLSAVDAVIMLAVFCLGLFVYRSQTADLRLWIGLALLVSVGVDYKVFGTSKRFNSGTGVGPRFSLTEHKGMDSDSLREMRAHSNYRVALDESTIFSLELRHWGLSTPQGFDPFLSSQFRRTIDRYSKLRTDREYDIDPLNEEALRAFGVRYYITAGGRPDFKKLSGNPRFRLIDATDTYFKVFEYLDAQPPFTWPGAIQAKTWEPERRALTTQSPGDARFILSEQFYPGWSATVDGRRVPIEREGESFQAIVVPAGTHQVEFRYREHLLPAGAWISLVTLLALIAGQALSLRRAPERPPRTS